MSKFEITTEAYGIVEKEVAPATKSASRVYLPIEWEGKRVMILLMEPLDEKK